MRGGVETTETWKGKSENLEIPEKICSTWSILACQLTKSLI